MRAARYALAWLSACGPQAPAPAPEPAPSVPVEAPAAVEAPAPPAPPPHAVRVVALSGKLVGTPAFAQGDTLTQAFSATLDKGAALTLALDDDVRIEVRGPAQLALLKDGAPVLLARQGLLSVDVAAQAARAGRAPFALATPNGQLEIPFAARLVLRADTKGAHELAVVSGELALSQPEGALSLAGGARVCVGAKGVQTLSAPGFSTLEAATAALPKSRACAGGKPVDPALTESELAQRLDALSAAENQERSVLAAYKGEPADARRLRDQLAALAQTSLLARTRALALRTQLEAAALDAQNDPGRAAVLARASELESPAR